MVTASDVEFPLPLNTQPMEARTAEALPREDGLWQYEPKWDGFRCLAFKSGKAVDLRAKSGKPLGRYFPELMAALSALAATEFVIDGEIIVEIEDRASFDALQMRLHPAESRIRKLSRETPAQLVVFDMAQKSACDLLSVVSPQSFNTAFCSSGFMAAHAVLKSFSVFNVFMPASVKNGDIFAGSSSADVLPAARAEPVIMESAIAPTVSILMFI